MKQKKLLFGSIKAHLFLRRWAVGFYLIAVIGTMASYGQTKLTSTDTIGTTTVWGSDAPIYLAAAFDGDFNTTLDNNENWGFVGYDFGATGATVETFKYAPRSGYAARMNGAVLRGSNSSNFLNEFDELYTISADPAEGALTEATVGSSTAYRYVYLFLGGGSYSNISELELYDASAVKLTGTVIGQENGSEWCSECTPDKAFDGSFDTYVEGPKTIGFVGFDFGTGNEVTLTSWKYAPRAGWASRLNGTELRGSNSLNYLTDYTVLSTIGSDPVEGVLTEAAVTDVTAYRFVYWKGNVDSYSNIAELEFWYSEVSTIATLQSLATDVGHLSPAFDAALTSYSIVVPDGTTEVNLTPVATDDGATISGGGTVAYSGTETSASIVVTAEDGTTTETYTVTLVPESTTLVHSYTFETDMTDVVGTVDATANGNATVEGGNLVLDEDGDFISWDGAALDLNSLSAISFEYMYHPAAGVNSGWNWATYFGNNGGANNIRVGFNTWNQITVINNGNENTEYWSVDGSGIGQADKDYHLVVILTDSRMTVYLDGEILTDKVTTGFNIGAAEAYIGKGSNDWGDPTWRGTVDEFNVFEGAMSLETISTRAYNYLNAKDATLAGLTVSAGTLTPAFETGKTHYAIEVPAGTTSVDITAIPTVDGVSIDGDGAIDLTGGETSADIVVTALNGTTTSTYTVDILFEGAGCFTPTYDDKVNLVTDPEMTDIANFQGWGAKELVYGFDAYCGLTAAVLKGPGCSSALDINPFAYTPGVTYRVIAMVKTVDGSIGILANGSDPNFGFAFDTQGEWLMLDTIFKTGANAGTNFFSFNTCDFSSNCTEAYVDNYEIYELGSYDATLSDLALDGTTINNFDAATIEYDSVLAAGTTTAPTVSAMAADDGATISITQATGLPGSATVVVSAEDGFSELTYIINFTVEDDPAVTADITFIVDDSQGASYTGFTLKGSWNTATGEYDTNWSGGAEHTVFYDDGTNGDATAGDHIWSVTVTLVSDEGANTWEWGFNDDQGNWIPDGNQQFTIPDGTAQTLDAYVIVGIEDAVMGSGILVYPTISKGDFTVATNEHVNLITVYDIKGEEVLKQNVRSTKQTISVPAAGFYIVKVSGDTFTKSFKVFKVN